MSLTNRQRWNIAGDLGPEWKQFGTNLGYSTGKLHQFLVDNHSVTKNAIYYMFDNWCKKNPQIDQIAAVQKALREADRPDLAMQLGQGNSLNSKTLSFHVFFFLLSTVDELCKVMVLNMSCIGPQNNVNFVS